MAEFEIVTTAEAATLKGVHQETVRRWCKTGQLKTARRSGRTWLMSKAELMAYQPPARGPVPRREDE